MSIGGEQGSIAATGRSTRALAGQHELGPRLSCASEPTAR